jgi:lipoprotein LprG
LFAFVFTACGEPTPEPLPPKEIIDLSANRMNGLEGFHFIVDRSGLPAYLDPDETISFRRAEGFYVSPDKGIAEVRVIAPGFVTDVSVISIQDIQWETNLLTNEWTELPPNWGFNPAVLFDPEIGIQSILVSDLTDLTFVGSEKLDDGPNQYLYVLEGEASGDSMYQMSYGLIGPENMRVKLWIAPETFELHRALITDPNKDGEEATLWQVDFSEFGRIVNIEPPPT